MRATRELTRAELRELSDRGSLLCDVLRAYGRCGPVEAETVHAACAELREITRQMKEFCGPVDYHQLPPRLPGGQHPQNFGAW
jgi:hypothetical protein